MLFDFRKENEVENEIILWIISSTSESQFHREGNHGKQNGCCEGENFISGLEQEELFLINNYDNNGR